MRRIQRFPFLLLLLLAGLVAVACEQPTETTPRAADPEPAPAASGAVLASSAPAEDGLIHACYVASRGRGGPRGSGMVYRIKADGLPDACRSEAHVAFSWPAATLLAGQSCPDGQFVTGVDADGEIVCAAPAGTGGAVDADADGFDSDVDCDDSDPDVHPGAPELADGVDNDCDGLVDESAEEVCDGTDNDGDGLVDEGFPYCVNGAPAPNTDGVACDPGFVDANGDPADGCEAVVEDADGDGFASDVDCDDSDPDVFPGAPELADGKDNDCDGTVDEGT